VSVDGKKQVLFFYLRVFKLLSVYVCELRDLVVNRFFHVEQLFFLFFQLGLFDFFLLFKVVVEACFSIVFWIYVFFWWSVYTILCCFNKLGKMFTNVRIFACFWSRTCWTTTSFWSGRHGTHGFACSVRLSEFSTCSSTSASAATWSWVWWVLVYSRKVVEFSVWVLVDHTWLRERRRLWDAAPCPLGTGLSLLVELLLRSQHVIVTKHASEAACVWWRLPVHVWALRLFCSKHWQWLLRILRVRFFFALLRNNGSPHLLISLTVQRRQDRSLLDCSFGGLEGLVGLNYLLGVVLERHVCKVMARLFAFFISLLPSRFRQWLFGHLIEILTKALPGERNLLASRLYRRNRNIRTRRRLNIKFFFILLPQIKSILFLFLIIIMCVLLQGQHFLMILVILKLLLGLIFILSHLVHQLGWQVDVVNLEVLVTAEQKLLSSWIQSWMSLGRSIAKGIKRSEHSSLLRCLLTSSPRFRRLEWSNLYSTARV